jgi:hypothetical protein
VLRLQETDRHENALDNPYCISFHGVLFSIISAKVPVTYLRDLVEQAEWIVIGRVVTVQDPNIWDKYGHSIKVAKIQPYTFLKGQQEPEFSIEFIPSLADQPHFVLKES